MRNTQTNIPGLSPDFLDNLGLPGVIGGYGGGTWNADGSVATPQAPMPNIPMLTPNVPPRTGMFGRGFGGQSAGSQVSPVPVDSAQQTSPLGGSMRQPFDYDAALARLVPPEKKESTWATIASIVGPALMAAGGNQAGANAMIQNMADRRNSSQDARRRAQEAVERWKHEDWSRQNGADLNASAPFTIGRDRLTYDPATGETASIYHGAPDFEEYARLQGLQPGTPGYNTAMVDYVLRANGPTALQGDRDLEALRSGNRLKLEDVRQGNRMELRGSPTYRDTHAPPPRPSTAGSGGGRRSSGRPTATGPNGQKVEWNGSDWVPAT
jgi:hypothetical protein